MKKRIFVIAVLVLLLLPAIAGCFSVRAGNSGVAVKVEYYYFNACAACNKKAEITEDINKILSPVKGSTVIDLQMINIFNSGNYDVFLDACKNAHIANPNMNDPHVFVNGKCLSGDEEIGQKLPALFLEAKDAAEPATAPDAGPNDSVLVYFYVSPCKDCDEIGAWLDKLNKEYTVDNNGRSIQSRIVVRKYNVAQAQNFELVRNYFNAYDVPSEKQKVPLMFLDKKYLSGVKDIENNLLPEIERGGALASGQNAIKGSLPAKADSADSPAGLPAVFLAGLVNGLNPCSLSMLLFFVATVLVKRTDIVKLGLLFIFGKMITYGVLGALLFTAFSGISSSVYSTVRVVIKATLTTAAIVAAAINLWDFVAARNERYAGIILQLPVPLRKFNHSMIGGIDKIANVGLLLPFSFLLGLVVAAGEFLCTGQIYLMTLIYLAKSSPSLGPFGISAILLYVVAMMIPLVVLLLIVWKGRSVYEVSESARKRIPAVKLANAALFLALAAAVLFFY